MHKIITMIIILCMLEGSPIEHNYPNRAHD